MSEWKPRFHQKPQKDRGGSKPSDNEYPHPPLPTSGGLTRQPFFVIPILKDPSNVQVDIKDKSMMHRIRDYYMRLMFSLMTDGIMERSKLGQQTWLFSCTWSPQA